jgi:small subunit ribosomal protein S5
VRAVLELSGILNVIAKSKGSKNTKNVVRATIKALLNMRTVATIAKERGVSQLKVLKG